MTSRTWIWLLAAACGGGELPAPRPATPPPTIAPVTCADVGVILRGKVPSDNDEAGPAREAAIATACRDDHWPADVIACVGDSRRPPSCLDKLSPMVAASYEARIAEWTTRYAQASDADGPDAETPCEVVAGAVGRLSDDVTLEHDWVVDARRRLVFDECSGWREPTKQCVLADPPPTDLASCMPDDVAKLDAISERAKKMAAAKQKPATITCAKVAAAYYADAEWKGKLGGASPKDRKAAITGSRAAMQKACTAGTWDDTLRACLATGGGAMCFADTNVSAADWGFPASATIVHPLPLACVEFERSAKTAEGCTSTPSDTRDVIAHLRQMVEQQSKDDPDGVVSTCQSALDVLSRFPTCP